MSEMAKTLTFLTAGLAAVAAAYFVDSSGQDVDVSQLVGQYLTDEIEVTAPHRMQIVKFDRATASVRQFEVAEVDGVWSIPSKENYPADATQQLAEAVTCVMQRKIFQVAGESARDHAQFGVIDPLSPNLDSKSTGVGTRVTMTDAEGATLVDVIIGKAVKDAPGQRYVRRGNQDVIYVVELDPKKLSTNFSDWIESDLLKLSAMDLRKVFIDDSSASLSIVQTPQGFAPQIGITPRDEISLTHADDAKPWEVTSLKAFDPAQAENPETRGMIDDKVAEDEEVNQDAVRDLVNGLDELLIVDIARKPEGLSADLKAGAGFLNKEEALSDLMRKGFFPGRQDSGEDMVSSEGEMVCTLRNGVEYVLRFGKLQVQTENEGGGDSEEIDVAGAAAAGDAAAGAAATAGSTDASADSAAEGENLRRYLFVMARFNEDAVERPQYKELPALPAEEEAPESEASAGSSEGAGEETAPSGEAATNAETDQNDAGAEDPDSVGADGDSEASTSEESSAESPGAEESTPEDAKPDETKPDRDAILAQRKAIEDENARMREEYEGLISSGRDEMAMLNERFGDWYFVISNDVYKQIHLGREQLIKKKEPPAAEGAGAGAEAAEPANVLEGVPDLGGAAPADSATEDAPADDAAAEDPSANDASAENGAEGAAAPAAPADDGATDAK